MLGKQPARAEDKQQEGCFFPENASFLSLGQVAVSLGAAMQFCPP